MRSPIAAVLAALALAACLAPPPPDRRLADELAAWMTGTFSSAEQHARDRDYESIRLVALPIWPERQDGPWLYVEQAAASSLSRPYRQRIYHLVPQRSGTVRSDIYLLPGEPLAWSGAWRKAAPLADLRPELLTPRDGCSIELHAIAVDRWAGATNGTGCASRRAGASYATAEVVLCPDHLESWDRGFDEYGRQVWGARGGPYHFDKLSNAAPD